MTLLVCLAIATVAPGAASARTAPARGAPATCAGVPATIVGTSGDDELTGTSGDDVIAGLDGVDTIDAGAGNDLVCGDAGPDTLVGGPGDDRLYAGTNGLVPVFEGEPEPAGDTIAPGPGDDLVDIGVNTVLRGDGWNPPDTIDYSTSATGVTVDLVSGVATGEGTDTVVVAQPQPATGYVVELLGSTHADHLLGTEYADQILGKGGGDHIEARGGDDLVMNDWDEYFLAPGDPADDVFDGGAGADYLDSTGGADILLGGAGADHLRKERGPATLDGGAGRDELEVYLSAGRHRLVGGAGRDEVSLGVLNSGRRTTGVLDHQRGRFVVRLWHRPPIRASVEDVERVRMPHNRGRWTYLGTSGDDRVTGGASYTARGRGGDDVLIGSYDDDVLLGGPGRDRIVGGRGDDRCRGEDLTGCESPS
ncbi:Ca2+-binding RTX toxin-like protein [Nocardioides sp. BE266]|uniref:calcium-binding protein n=1 Tax=Nocardioides sp. BE266 TaxID=2817725 RepID=UPI002857122C|nr:calcium-binding protein [Nocardioides sp. BE266]MDR7252461.1 Ca2+-binding RTX toxin-like protein [Nocardioides sp. BE266]